MRASIIPQIDIVVTTHLERGTFWMINAQGKLAKRYPRLKILPSQGYWSEVRWLSFLIPMIEEYDSVDLSRVNKVMAINI